jgi:hypothetical protein
MNERVLLDKARWGLAALWFIWAFLLILVMVVQSILGKYGEQAHDAWSWFIPTFVPTLLLMIGVLGEGALVNQPDIRTVKKNFYYLTFGISGGYLFILSLTILMEPFAPQGAIALYLLSNFWLGPLQGIAGGAIGLLFTSQQHEKPPPAP